MTVELPYASALARSKRLLTTEAALSVPEIIGKEPALGVNQREIHIHEDVGVFHVRTKFGER
jgi:hypothetical protein